MTNLTQRLWKSIARSYEAILRHPFLQELTTGELDEEIFRYYIIQDSLYLNEYARALALCAARAPDNAAIEMFAEHAAGAILVERELHEIFFAEFGLSHADISRIELAPTNVAYTSYLVATAYRGSFAEALGAVLPCYWIYKEVGSTLLAEGSSNALYQRWIDTYGGDDYSEIVNRVLHLTDELEDNLGTVEQTKMTRHFQVTARFEWMFWDMAYRREAWPV